MHVRVSDPARIEPNHETQRPAANTRLRWMLIAMLALAFIAVGGPSRVLTRYAYAIERGRIQAASEALAQLDSVSNAFRLVADVARPGVVQIVASARRDEDDEQLRQRREEIREELDEIERRLEQEGLSEEESMQLLRRERNLRIERGRIEGFLEQRREGSGSGVVLDQQGNILTNNHVATAGDDLLVRFADGRSYRAELVGADSQSDLAVIKVDAAEVHPLKFGDSDAMMVGDWVLAVGAPFGLDQTVTHGIISAKGRTDIDIGHGIIYQDFLQTDASINPGNSGGPLLNLRGEVIGINTAIATASQGFNAGVAFTIPSNMARRVADQLKRSGEVARGWLGITMAELTNEDRELLGAPPNSGVLVDQVIENDPADQGGLLVEDVIVEANGRPVANLAQLRGVIADIAPGETAALKIIRGGEQQELRITFGRRPALPGRVMSEREQPVMVQGIGGVRTLRPSQARLFDREESDRGVRVADVSLQTRGTFRPDDLIVAVNGAPVNTLAELKRGILNTRKNTPVRLEVEDLKGARRTVEIEPPASQ